MDETKDVSQMTDAELQALIGQGDETVAEPEPEVPAAPPVAETAPEAAPKEDRHVPLAELLEERGRRKEAQARMEEMERRLAEMQRGWQEHMAQLQAQPQAEPEVPAFDADPLEHLRQQQERLQQTLAMTQRQMAEREMARRQQEQWHAMREGVNAAEQAYAQQVPDYYEAVNYLRDHRAQQYKAAGVPEQQIPALLQRDAVTVAQAAASLGQSPAEFAYRQALGLNYRPKGAQQSEPKPGAAPKSLGGASGRSDATAPNLADVSKMSDKEFNALFDKMMTGT